MKCAECGKKNVNETMEHDTIGYGEEFCIRILVPVWTCKDCECRFQTEDASVVREAAIQGYLQAVNRIEEAVERRELCELEWNIDDPEIMKKAREVLRNGYKSMYNDTCPKSTSA